MTEPNPVEGEPKAPVEGTAASDAPAQPFRVFATEDDYKAHEAKRKEQHERELKTLRKENETLKQASMTEAEQASAKAQADHAKALESAERRADVKAILMSQGIAKELAGVLVKNMGDEWDDPSEAATALVAQYGLAPKPVTKPVAGGGGRAPDNGEPVNYTPEYVQEMLSKYGSGWYTPEHRKKAEEYRAINYKGIKQIARS